MKSMMVAANRMYIISQPNDQIETTCLSVTVADVNDDDDDNNNNNSHRDTEGETNNPRAPFAIYASEAL